MSAGNINLLIIISTCTVLAPYFIDTKIPYFDRQSPWALIIDNTLLQQSVKMI